MMWHGEEHFTKQLDERRLEKETLRQLVDEYERVIPRLVHETQLADEDDDYMDTALCKACVENQRRYDEAQKELSTIKERHRFFEIGLKDRDALQERLRGQLAQAQKAADAEKRKLQALKDHAASALEGAEAKLSELRKEHEGVMGRLADSLQEAKAEFRTAMGPYNAVKEEVAMLKRKHAHYDALVMDRITAMVEAGL